MLRGQYLLVAVLLTLMLVLLVVSAFLGLYQSKLPAIKDLTFPSRAQKTAELI